MRFAFKFFLLLALILPEVACVTVTGSNLREGIACFRAENYREAFIHLKPEADRGQHDAEYAVGYMYYYGQGVIENRKQAWIWINRAAKAGQRDALIAIKLLRRPPTRPVKRPLDPLDPLIYNSHSSNT